MGERLHGELQPQAKERVAEQGDILHADGGEDADGAVQADVQPNKAA